MKANEKVMKVARGAARCLLQHASPAELRARRPLPHRWLDRDQGPCGAAVPWRGSRTGYNGPHALLGAGCDSKCPLTRNGGPPHRRSSERQRRHLPTASKIGIISGQVANTGSAGWLCRHPFWPPCCHWQIVASDEEPQAHAFKLEV